MNSSLNLSLYNINEYSYNRYLVTNQLICQFDIMKA